jgi:hypothetical protein
MGIYARTVFLLALMPLAFPAAGQNTKILMPTSPISLNHPSGTPNTASGYVALDSWVYPAYDRLAALGAVQTAFSGLRPWTRLDCARLLSEMEELRGSTGADDEATEIYAALRSEFSSELHSLDGHSNAEVRVESIYFRNDVVLGKPLTDGYHFAQTETNNFGRPYGQGLNSYAGTSLRAAAGPFAAYIRVEFQHAGSGLSVPAEAQSAIALADFTPTAQFGPVTNISRGRVLDAYVIFGFHNNQLSFGKQSMWWGPGKGGPLLWSNNAEPFTMLRYDRIRPVELPSVGRLLGPIRTQFFIGRLEGQQFVHSNAETIGQAGISYADQPFIYGQKISFKPTPNLEFSVSRTVIFGGPHFPVTFSSFWHSLVSTGNSAGKSDPGDRRSAFDVSYRVPGLRDWLTVYADTFTDDEPFPLAYPTESAWAPGFYLPRLPHLHKLDLRAEGFLTPHRDLFPGFYYFNVRYLSGYTNNRQLIGNWIGREGNGLQIWSTWWISPRASIQGSYRSLSVSPEFLRGGNLRDIAVTSDLPLGRQWSVHLSGQYERWNFPLLVTNSSRDIAVSAQLTWAPSSRMR